MNTQPLCQLRDLHLRKTWKQEQGKVETEGDQQEWEGLREGNGVHKIL